MKLVCGFQCTGMAASGLGKGRLRFGALSPKTPVINYTFYPRTPTVGYFRLAGNYLDRYHGLRGIWNSSENRLG